MTTRLTDLITEGIQPGYVGGQNLLVDKYNQTFQLVDDMGNEVGDILDELKDLFESLIMPAGWYDRLRAVSIIDVPDIDLESITEPGVLTLPGFDDVTFPIAPVLSTAPDIDLTYEEPEAPAEINPNLNYTMSTYSSDIWLDLFTKIQQGIVTEGEGLGSGVEAELWNRGRNRIQEESETAYDNAVADLSNRAVPYPTLARRAVEARVSTSVLRRKADINSDITIEMARLAQSHYHKMLDSALDLEKIAREFYKVQETLSLDAAKAAAQLVIDTYESAIKGFIAEWDGIGKSLEAKIQSVRVVLESNKVLADMYDSQVRGAIGQTQAITAERQSLVDGYRGEVDAYSAMVKAQTEKYAALNDNQKNQLEASRLELEQAVEELKAQVELITKAGSVQEQILATQGQIASQVMASALNAVNTGITHSTGATEHRSDSQSWTGIQELTE